MHPSVQTPSDAPTDVPTDASTDASTEAPIQTSLQTPIGAAPAVCAHPPGTQRPAWLWLAACWGLLLLLAALRPLAVPDEGRYGEIGRWMLQSGDWLAPRLNGIPFFHKPPYLYWLEAVSLALLGASAWALRLVPALHAGLMLLGLYVAVRRTLGEGLARLAVLVLGSSLAFLIGGQYVNHDMLVASWISTAIWAFALAFEHAWQTGRPHAGWACLGFAACAMGVLSKGLIGLALPGLVLLLWLLWTRQFGAVRRLPWARGLALFALLALPWFFIAQRHFPGMLDYLVGTQQVTRFTGSGFNNVRPWWFYGLCLLLLLFPWSFLAPLAWRWRRMPLLQTLDEAGRARLQRMLRLCGVWLLGIVGFFSIPQSKLIGYVLPVMPPLALLAALGFEACWGAWRQRTRLLCAFTALALLSVGAAQYAAQRWTAQHAARDVALALAARQQPGDTVWVLGEQYPYDLPFYAGLAQPMVLVQDWPELARSAGDNWARELFEGARFDAQAAQVLQGPQAFAAARQQAADKGQWVLAPNGAAALAALQGLERVDRGQAWTLYRMPPAPAPAPASGAKRPVAAQ